MSIGIDIAYAIQKYVIGGYEIRSVRNLRELSAEDAAIDVYILDEESGIYFTAQAKVINDKVAVKKEGIFELKGNNGVYNKYLFNNISVANMLTNGLMIPEGHSYMLDSTESESFDQAEIALEDHYVEDSFLSLMTGNRAFAVSNKTENKAHIKGAWRSAFAKFVDPSGEIIKPGLRNVEGDLEEQDELKGEFSKSKTSGKNLAIVALFAVTVTILASSGIGLTFLAIIPLYLQIIIVSVPLAFAIGVHFFGNKLQGDTKAIIFYGVTTAAFAALLATLCWAVPVISPIIVIPVIAVSVIGLVLLLLAKVLKNHPKTYTVLRWVGLCFTITPLLLGGLRYFVSSLFLVRPIVALISLAYKYCVNSVYDAGSSNAAKIIGGIVHLTIVAPSLGLISGICTLFGAKSPLELMHFNQRNMSEKTRFWSIEVCHALALAISRNFWKALLATTVISFMAVAIASTGGLAGIIAVLPFISNIATLVSALPWIGTFTTWLFVSGPLTALFSTLTIGYFTVLSGAIVSVILAIPVIKQAFKLIKELLVLNAKTGGRIAFATTAIGITLLSLGILSWFGGAIIIGAGLLYWLITIWYQLYRRNEIAKWSKRETIAFNISTFGLSVLYNKFTNRKKNTLRDRVSATESIVSSTINNRVQDIARPKKSKTYILRNLFSALGAIFTVVGIIWLFMQIYQWYQSGKRQIIESDDGQTDSDDLNESNDLTVDKVNNWMIFFAAVSIIGFPWVVYVWYQQSKNKTNVANEEKE